MAGADIAINRVAIMTTYAINLATGASTRYDNYDFDSFCCGQDGKYYGIKADGIYLLEGDVDATIDLGEMDFGTSLQKRLVNAYVSASCAAPLQMSVQAGGGAAYNYQARTSSDPMKTHRIDFGKGLKANYFSITITNPGAGDFAVDAVEILINNNTRRI